MADIVFSNEYRFKHILNWNKRLNDNKYDYESEGVLNKVLPKILFKGNRVLVTFIQLIDLKIIMLLSFIDRIKYFKNILRY